jgi:hypothetical protein
MWKSLCIFAGIILLAAGGIMYTQVRPIYVAELKQRDAAKENLALARKNQTESKTASTQADADLTKSKALLAENTGKKEKAQKDKDDKDSEVKVTTERKNTDEKSLTDLEEKLKGLGGLPQLVADLKALEAKNAQLNSDIDNTKGAIASLIAHKEATDKVIAALKLREIYQKTGTVTEGASTRVISVSQELGFYVLGSGNRNNVTKNSKWDVVRDGTVIARLVVTAIEPNRSTAELVPGTLAPGMQVLPGDRVVVSSSSTPRALAASVTSAAARPASGGAAPAAGTQPAAPAADVSDPFAAPGGTETPPMETPAPAAETPAAPDLPPADPAPADPAPAETPPNP